MNRKDRRAAQKRGGPTASPMATVLASAFRAHQAGHRLEAERQYRDVLAAEPRNAAALHLLGVLAHQSGRTEEGISLIGQAIAIEPRNPDVHYNLGSILQSAGRLDDAAAHFEKAVALNPKYTQAQFELAGLRARMGRWAEAEAGFRRVLAEKPSDVGTLNNLGMVLREQGQLEEAIAVWQRAVTASPTFHLAHMNLGLAFKTQGRADEALASLSRALELAPNAADAIYNLAVAQLDLGRHDQALQTILRGIDRSDGADLRTLFTTCIQTMPRIPADAKLRGLIARAMAEGWSRPEPLAPVAVTIVKGDAVIAKGIVEVNRHWPRPVAITEMLPPGGLAVLAQDDLLAAALESAPVPDIDLERVLTGLRFSLLAAARQNDAAATADKVVRLSAAMARQCFLNGYAWVQSEDEATRVRELQNLVEQELRNGQRPQPHWLASIAAYMPLHALPFAEQLLKHDWPAPVAALIGQQIREPAEERALAGSLPAPASGSADDDASPSPRWTAITPARRPLSIDAYLRNGFPHAPLRPLGNSEPLEILVAGCGTGRSAIEIAGRHLAKVMALDPDPANIACAMRQARRYGRTGIGFAVGDADAVTQSFDVIDATGALAAAPDAAALLSGLASKLRPNGVMLIAVDGMRLRQAIDAGRDFARGGNYQSDAEGIRVLRQNILKLAEGHDARAIAMRADFYSTGSCRDVLFRNQDRPLTLATAEAAIADAGLVLLGFDVDLRIAGRYRARFTDDAGMTSFANWQALERDEPDMAAMSYDVWLQKR